MSSRKRGYEQEHERVTEREKRRKARMERGKERAGKRRRQASAITVVEQPQDGERKHPLGEPERRVH